MQPVTVPVSSTVFSPCVQVVLVPPTVRSVKERPTRILGIFQIIIGALCLIFGIILVSFGGDSAFQFVPVAIGVWVSIGGILGIFSAAKKTNQHLNVANTCFAIVSFISAAAVFGVFVFLVLFVYQCGNSWNRTSYWYKQRVRYFVCVVLLILFITEFIVSIAAVVYGFKNICGCCPPKSNEETTQLYQRSGIQSAMQVTPISTQYDQPQSTDQDPPPVYFQTTPQITMMTTKAPISNHCIPPLPPSDTS